MAIRTLPELDQLPDNALITEPEARSFFSVSRTTFWRGCKSGTYPAPQKLGARMLRWSMASIRKSLRDQAA